jgi:hypothetical protein
LAITSLINVAQQIYGVIQDIDEHFLSLADDIRMFSGNVALAEAEANIIRMSAMIRRAQIIGPEVGEYTRQRALLDAQITDMVTELEMDLLPLAIEVLKGVRQAADVVKEFTWFNDYTLIGAISKALTRRDEAAERRKSLSILTEVEDLLAGKGDPPIVWPKPSRPPPFH